MQEAPYLFTFIFDCTRSSLLCVGFSLVETRRGYSVAVLRFLTVMASLVAEHRLQASGFQLWQHTGLVAVAQRLSCSAACGIVPRPGVDPESPALAGGFLSGALSGNSRKFLFYKMIAAAC